MKSHHHSSGLIIYPDGPLSLSRPSERMSQMFRTYHALLRKIRDLLLELTAAELRQLEMCLCSNEASADPNANVDGVAADTTSSADTATIADDRNNANQQPSDCPPQRIGRHRRSISADRRRPPTDSTTNRDVSPGSLTSTVFYAPAATHTAATSPQAEKTSPLTSVLFERPTRSLRSRFKSTHDMIHRLFVCISGVADQLQVFTFHPRSMRTQVNYPSDSRAILKAVLQSTEVIPNVHIFAGRPAVQPNGAEAEETGQELEPNRSPVRAPPPMGIAQCSIHCLQRRARRALCAGCPTTNAPRARRVSRRSRSCADVTTAATAAASSARRARATSNRCLNWATNKGYVCPITAAYFRCVCATSAPCSDSIRIPTRRHTRQQLAQ